MDRDIVYLNGIPVTDAEGITTMDDIDFGSIGNVEALKGPAGTLYGLAIAGAINLNTIKPEKEKFHHGDILIGNYGLRRFTTHFQTSVRFIIARELWQPTFRWIYNS